MKTKEMKKKTHLENSTKNFTIQWRQSNNSTTCYQKPRFYVKIQIYLNIFFAIIIRTDKNSLASNFLPTFSHKFP